MMKRLTSTTAVMIISMIIVMTVFTAKIRNLPPQIPLFYSRLEGNDQIADLFMIFLLPLLSFLIVQTNSFITKRYFRDNPFVSKVTYYINLSVICLIMFIFLRIIFLVT